MRWHGSTPMAISENGFGDQFEGDFKVSFNLASPILGGGKDALGRPLAVPSAPG